MKSTQHIGKHTETIISISLAHKTLISPASPQRMDKANEKKKRQKIETKTLCMRMRDDDSLSFNLALK